LYGTLGEHLREKHAQLHIVAHFTGDRTVRDTLCGRALPGPAGRLSAAAQRYSPDTVGLCAAGHARQRGREGPLERLRPVGRRAGLPPAPCRARDRERLRWMVLGEAFPSVPLFLHPVCGGLCLVS
jgi:hypothetical protein